MTLNEISINENAKPVILGIEGVELTPKEIHLFKEFPPVGFIFFQRNCQNKEQVKKLINDLKDLTQCNCPILIDQEGGRVSRLKAPEFKEYLAPSTFKTTESAYLNAKTMAKDLKELGLNVNCTPLLDLVFSETHNIIGDRSFGNDPVFVAKMAAAVIKGHFDEGIIPVIKHLPGHGRATTDSHEELPIVKDKIDLLKETDFKAFKLVLEDIKQYPMPWGMTAHIVFEDIDSQNCATQSPLIIEDVIREYIGFKGVLLSDCVTMKALKGAYFERVKKSLDAGCSIALHCSGHIDEMENILKAL